MHLPTGHPLTKEHDTQPFESKFVWFNPILEMTLLHPTTPYSYGTLPAGKYFRYLVLSPGSYEDPLVCSLHACLLEDAPSFEALSYVWGSSHKPCTLACEGKTIPITENLFRALKQVRYPAQPRRLWADSCCIDQENLQERGHQVYFMDEIYRRSEQTLICIGLEDHGNAELASKLVSKVAGMVVSQLASLEKVAKSEHDGNFQSDLPWNYFPWLDAQDPLLHDHLWTAFDELMKNPWFTRGWVVQEAAIAIKSTVLWSRTQISWQDIMRVCIWVNRRSPESFIKRLDYLPQVQMMAHHHRYPQDFRAFYPNLPGLADVLTILHHGRLLRFLENRDRIFAFRSLARLTATEDLFDGLNYSQNYTESYHTFMCNYLRKKKEVVFLRYVSHETRTLQDVHMPSWVIRWDVPMEMTFDIRGPSIQLRNSVAFRPVLEDNNRVLRVRGVLLDRIEHVFDTEREASLFSIVRHVQDVMKRTNREDHYGDGDRLEAFLDTLCVGRFLGSWRDWCVRRKTLLHTLNEVIQQHLEPSTDHLKKHDNASFFIIFSAIRRALWNRRFITTEQGYYGLAPAVAKPGDWCSTISGTAALTTLREALGESEFRTLGPIWLASKHTWESDMQIFHHMLGDKGGSEWEDEAQEQDIFLI
jgi:hypothetical protein